MAGGWKTRALIATVVTLPIAAFILRALGEVMEGRGNDVYFSYRGAQLNWSGALVTAGLTVVCMVGACGYAWWYRRRDGRDIEAIEKGKTRA